MKTISIHIDTVNGTGSLSANQMLTRMIFRSGLDVGSYNFFPSNIAGLPCSYNLHIGSTGFVNSMAYNPEADIIVSLSPKTLVKNIFNLKKEGLLVTDDKNKTPIECKSSHYDLPISQSISLIPSVPVKMKTFLKNILYVALIAQWLKLDKQICLQVLKDFFPQAKSEVLDLNLQAFDKGTNLARQNPLPSFFKNLDLQTSVCDKNLRTSPSDKSQQDSPDYKNKQTSCNSEDLILMDGNAAMALGALFAGCQFLSWYPITPASSVSESFEKFANKYQVNKQGKKRFVVLQSEDEIAALTQVIGASWAGLRAMTVTSGPGLSLMAEAAGLSYFSETPSVVCNIQRAGPSTGLPTRTQQADLLSSCFLSHGDSRHIVLMPGTLEECFSLTYQAFDLAEQLQTLVIILSDLDLGMNLQTGLAFDYKKQDLKRGKILSEKDLKSMDFYRYKDVDGDGISYRSLPGTNDGKQSYLTRGSGHDEKANYSEDPTSYSNKLDKLKVKWETAKSLVPEPVIDSQKDAAIAFVTFGNNTKAIQTTRQNLKKQNVSSNFMRIRSFPFTQNVKDFLEKQSEVFIVEQNRDAQLKQLLSGEFIDQAHKFKSILQYDGRPFYSKNIEKQFKENRKTT